MSHNSTIGITDAETVMLDFDNTPFKLVKEWALKTVKRFRLGGFIILKSSRNCYHVVFDRKVTWAENVAIMAWVCIFTKHRKLNRWFLLQCIKEEPTLRVSKKGKKPSPRIVYRHGKQDIQIQDFLNHREMLKEITGKLPL